MAVWYKLTYPSPVDNLRCQNQPERFHQRVLPTRKIKIGRQEQPYVSNRLTVKMSTILIAVGNIICTSVYCLDIFYRYIVSVSIARFVVFVIVNIFITR